MTGFFQILKDNWSIILAIGAAGGTVIGWCLTFYGWRRTYYGNVKLEQEKYRISLDIERRRAELAFINDQIRLLYGPLFALGSAADQAFWSFRVRYSGGRATGILHFNDETDVVEGMRQWRLWMQQIIMPLNIKMEETIIVNSHLIRGQTISESFLEFLAHVETYKAVVKNWDVIPLDLIEEMPVAERLRLHTSIVDFPAEFHKEVADSFVMLKERQEALLSASLGEGKINERIAPASALQ